MSHKEAMKTVRRSIQYEIRNAVLTVTGYYTGESFQIDLSKLTEEMFEELQPDADDEEMEDTE
jgi:hypothetical protein